MQCDLHTFVCVFYDKYAWKIVNKDACHKMYHWNCQFCNYWALMIHIRVLLTCTCVFLTDFLCCCFHRSCSWCFHVLLGCATRMFLLHYKTVLVQKLISLLLMDHESNRCCRLIIISFFIVSEAELAEAVTCPHNCLPPYFKEFDQSKAIQLTYVYYGKYKYRVLRSPLLFPPYYLVRQSEWC